MALKPPSAYDWLKLLFGTLWLTKHFSSRTKMNKKYVVIHHMTIVGKGTGSALLACYNTWQNRVASAHYGVDGFNVAQFVRDKDFAWATASNAGNENGISIEHANSTAAPGWKVAENTWQTGARLAGTLCFVYSLGRPKMGTTIRKHSDFFPTACPGPFLGGSVTYKAYVAEAARVYDLLKAGKAYTSPGSSQPSLPIEPTKPPASTDRMDPKAYFIGARGAHVKWYGERLVLHLEALGIKPAYQVGPSEQFTPTDQVVTKQFQNAQGWSGDDADGFPGPETLKRLAAAPAPAHALQVMVGATINLAGNNAKGIATGATRVKRYAIARKVNPVDIVSAQECTVASRVRPTMDSALGALGYDRAGGGEGRYSFNNESSTKVIAAGMFTVPSKHWYKKDDKQASWVIYEKNGFRGMEVGLHLEYRPGAVADQARVDQALDIVNMAMAKADDHGVLHCNVTVVGDFNSEGKVLGVLEERGWVNAAKGTRFENEYTFMGWDGKSRKRYDYVLVLGTAPYADLVDARITALSRDTTISDHGGIRYVRNLVKI